jgi:hypothetical protein
MMAKEQPERDLERRIAERYEGEGYKVDVQPQPESLPFDLGAYEPDMVVKLPNGEHLVIEVKTTHTNLDVDHMRAVAETVTRHPGWRFLLVTDAERMPLPEVGSGAEPLTPAQIKQRLTRVDLLMGLGETEGAYLSIWSLLEALLRRRAEDVKLPLERMATGALIDYLYSEGELSIPQYDLVRELMPVRDALAHGFAAPQAGEALPKLRDVVDELATAWWPE